ncbi:MAG: type II toxin-antitoxin system VapC family toxin, partial [Thermococcus sp.]|nr:type II toxin-antitoxin system VapC family toxin [Thermococcus sp.]
FSLQSLRQRYVKGVVDCDVLLKENITIYDALYIALAEALKAELLTADEKQYYAAKNYVEARLIR